MAKHKEVKMWAAFLTSPWRGDAEVRTVELDVVETAKQYRVPRQKDTEISLGIECREKINKEGNNILFTTELGALKNLDKYLTRQEELATRRAEVAQHNLWLISEALANKGS